MLPRMSQVVEAAFVTVSGTAIVGVAGFGAGPSTPPAGTWRTPASTESGISAPEPMSMRLRLCITVRPSDYEMRTATLDEHARQYAEAYLAEYKPTDWFGLEARLIAFASPEVVTAMQKSSTAHVDAVNAFAAEQAALRAQEASGDPVSGDHVSRLMQSTMSSGARQEADNADSAVTELIRKDMHGHGQPLTDWVQFPD